ncbi:elongation factor-like GTPase 1 isoform X1 [Amphibalanus amphitrite]|uniref:elongation factor-like GTPase 1 isoform X1 n=1 Tax=Amphibalanus amphitrite TaxID=1232801 RepID=UPI001C90F80B|nr:elongation factor-like GTPase 1 isoform X1 [Amphibalanus amphitrite]
MRFFGESAARLCRPSTAMPRTVSAAQLAALQRHPDRVRNICILAHVDHGKTTLADALVASNGVISPRLAGRLRYLDSRPDEQRRGITMKSSAIALHHTDPAGQHQLVNLIDSPGHVDFSSEVSTAVRLCDGALVLVDVVEGVCAQTEVVLRQAWTEGIRPVLVLNKIDRLVLELGLTPLSAHVHLTQVLEQVNAVMAELFTTEFLERPAAAPRPDPSPADAEQDPATRDVSDWSTGLEDADDSSVYFSPDAGNVLFASAYDGWGFGIRHFSRIYSEKLGIREEVLNKTLWGDFYLNAKTKRIMKGAQEKAKVPLFVQFILQNVWAAYEAIAVRRDKDMTEKIISRLKLTVSPRDMRSTDPRVQLQAVFSQWLPLAPAVLDMVVARLPAASSLSEERAERLLAGRGVEFDQLPDETRALRELFTRCDAAEEAPVIVFVSKMVAVDRSELPENRARPLTAEEMERRREEARRRHAERAAAAAAAAAEGTPDNDASAGVPLSEEQVAALRQSAAAAEQTPEPAAADPKEVFVAFARVFSGTLRPGRRLLVLGPKHDPAAALQELAAAGAVATAASLAELAAGQHITECTVGPLYLLMGRALEELTEAPAGCVVGIGGLADHVLKSATLASTPACPAFSELSSAVVPIVRVAVEPARPADLPRLVAGLRLLNQADGCVRVTVQESGEHVLTTAGEVHLQRCLDDLRERFAGVEINASEPIVPFRETIVEPPKTDMVNEAIEERAEDPESTGGLVEVTTPGRRAVLAVRAVPLPTEATELLDANAELLASLLRRRQRETAETDAAAGRLRQLSESAADGEADGEPEKSETELSEKNRRELHELLGREQRAAPAAAAVSWSRARRCRDELRRRLAAADSPLVPLVDRVWSFGPRRCGPNLLINATSEYSRPSVWEPSAEGASDPTGPMAAFDDSVVHGFQLATAAGPLCEEPMRGVCFLVESLTLQPADEEDGVGAHGPLSGQIMSAVSTACRRAFQAQPQRLMAAMYRCQVQVTGQALGRMYSVIGRRGGRILHGDRNEGSHSFSVTAYVPVVESFRLAQELRKGTSGLALPQLVFSHWETLDTDPFWVPTTEEEYLLYGQKADTENAARRHMNAVRRRKGLAVDEKIVEFGEKQRTLARKK